MVWNFCLPSRLPVARCEPQSDDAAGASSDYKVEKALNADLVTELYLELPQDLQFDYASYTAPAAGQKKLYSWKPSYPSSASTRTPQLGGFKYTFHVDLNRFDALSIGQDAIST
jgi:hypothetical protein